MDVAAVVREGLVAVEAEAGGFHLLCFPVLSWVGAGGLHKKLRAVARLIAQVLERRLLSVEGWRLCGESILLGSAARALRRKGRQPCVRLRELYATFRHNGRYAPLCNFEIRPG
jgi:hypothetical protein